MDLPKKEGFSLIEILVVIGIIGLLGTIAIVGLNQAREQAKTTKATADIATIRKAIDILANDTNEWPGHQTVDSVCASCGSNELCGDGCTNTLSSGPGGLTQNDSGTPYSNWDGPYMAIIPIDPWGNQYFFDTDYDIDFPNGDNRAVLGSYGPNGVGNNDYDSDDIILILAQ